MLKWLILLLFLFIAPPAIASEYSTRQQFISKVQTAGTHYIVFSGPWCPHCKTLRNRLTRMGLADKVIFLDVSDEFAFAIAARLKIPCGLYLLRIFIISFLLFISIFLKK